MYIDFDGPAPARNYPATSRADAHVPAASCASANPRASFAEISAEVTAQTDPAREAQVTEQKPAKPVSYWENGDFGFGDFIDTINPLQHLPIVATIYRNMTGDRIGMVPRVVGGALWGRIGGFVSGVLNAVVEWFTGKDVGDHIYAFLRDKLSPSGDVQTAHDQRAGETVHQFSETIESAPHHHASIRGPLATQSAFEDLSSYPRAEPEVSHAALRPGRSFPYSSDASDAQAPSEPRRLRLSA